MKEEPQLIVMLTYQDHTIENAEDVFEQCKDSEAAYFGMKEKGISQERMKALFAHMKECGKCTVLEVVAYTEAECLQGAYLAKECGCDMLIGTLYFDAVNAYCKEHQIRYMPYVGKVTGRPSVLEGEASDMLSEAQQYQKQGVYGINLLGYRYQGDARELNESIVLNTGVRVCLAGSVDSYQKLDEVKRLTPWAFTIGSAFFDNCFDGTICEQIHKVCEYMQA